MTRILQTGVERDLYGSINFSVNLSLDLKNRIKLGKYYSKIRWVHYRYFLRNEREFSQAIEEEVALGIRSNYAPLYEGWNEFAEYWSSNGRTPSYERWLLLCQKPFIFVFEKGRWEQEMLELSESEKENGYSNGSVDWPPLEQTH